MENCENSQAELEENSTVCPECGGDHAAEEAPAAEEAVETANVMDAIPETVAAELEVIPEGVPEAVSEAAPEAPAEEKKSNTMKIVLSAAALLVILAVLIAAIVSGMAKKDNDVPPEADADASAAETAVLPTVPEDGNPDDQTCKGTYTADDAALVAARDVVVAHAGDKVLTNAELQVYYWMEVRNFLSQYGAYAAYFGLDYQQPLDTQICGVTDTPMTWQQYFLKTALDSWHHYQAMAAQAAEDEIPLSEEFRKILDTTASDLNETAAANGMANADELLKRSLGSTVEMADYLSFMECYYNGYSYFNAMDESIEPTDEELEAYFTENAAKYEESGVTKESRTIDVRHILVYPEGADSSNVNTEEFSEEAWAAGEAAAQAILDEWLAGDATEDSFAELANERSGDPGSNTNGGLYTDVREGEMVQAFNDWCFDAERQVGDYGIVKTNYGFHVMYYVGSHLIWMDHARSDYKNEKGSEMVDAVTGKYPMNVDYSAILLGLIDLT